MKSVSEASVTRVAMLYLACCAKQVQLIFSFISFTGLVLSRLEWNFMLNYSGHLLHGLKDCIE